MEILYLTFNNEDQFALLQVDMPYKPFIGLTAIIAALFACAQEPPKTDWLENAPEITQNAASGGDDSLSNVGHANSHSGHR